MRLRKFFPRQRKEICRARRRVSGPGRRVSVSFAGRSGSTRRQSRPRNELRFEPFDAYSLAVSCGGRGVPLDTCPASHSARRPLALPRTGTRLRIAPPSRARPRATACCHLHARLIRQARAVYRAPQRNGRRGVAPVRARPRRGARCPCGASTALPRKLRRGTWDTFRCRLTPDTSSGNAPRRRRVSAADSTTPSLIPH